MSNQQQKNLNTYSDRQVTDLESTFNNSLEDISRSLPNVNEKLNYNQNEGNIQFSLNDLLNSLSSINILSKENSNEDLQCLLKDFNIKNLFLDVLKKVAFDKVNYDYHKKNQRLLLIEEFNVDMNNSSFILKFNQQSATDQIKNNQQITNISQQINQNSEKIRNSQLSEINQNQIQLIYENKQINLCDKNNQLKVNEYDEYSNTIYNQKQHFNYYHQDLSISNTQYPEIKQTQIQIIYDNKQINLCDKNNQLKVNEQDEYSNTIYNQKQHFNQDHQNLSPKQKTKKIKKEKNQKLQQQTLFQFLSKNQIVKKEQHNSDQDQVIQDKNESIKFIQNNQEYQHSEDKITQIQFEEAERDIEKQIKHSFNDKMCYCIQDEELKYFVTICILDKTLQVFYKGYTFQIQSIKDTKGINLICCHYNKFNDVVVLTIIRKSKIVIYEVSLKGQNAREIHQLKIDSKMISSNNNYKMFSDCLMTAGPEQYIINRIFKYDMHNLHILQIIGNNQSKIKKFQFEEGISFAKLVEIENQQQILIGLRNKCIKRLDINSMDMDMQDVLSFYDNEEFDIPIDCFAVNKEAICIIFLNGIIYYDYKLKITSYKIIENIEAAFYQDDKLFIKIQDDQKEILTAQQLKQFNRYFM